jgi:hypothetical protein
MPPSDGYFFYSDFMLDHSKGFHALTLQIADGRQTFFTSVSTNEFELGLYMSTCDTCQATTKYEYLLGSSGQEIDSTPVNYMSKVHNERGLDNVEYTGNEIRDTFKVYFQQYNRSTTFTNSFYAVTQEYPSVPQIWDGYVGIMPYTANMDRKE